MWRFRLVFFHFDQIMKLTLRVLSLPEETCILILDISVFSPLRSILIRQKHVSEHFWSLVFSCVFEKIYNFLQIFIVFNMFAFFSCFFRAQRGDLDFYKIFKNGFAPSIWHLNNKKTQNTQFWLHLLVVFLQIY